MADPLVRLDTQRASVQPGGQTQVVVTVTNLGTVVEGYQVLALGAAAPWARVVPGELSVYPQQEATATVVFSPPGGAGAPGGTIAFGVLARSTLDPRVSAVAEGEIEVGEVHGLAAKLVPVTSAGRWRGRHVLQVSNSGNTAATLRFRASDPDAALGFYLQPEIVELAAGGRASVRMSVRTLHPFLRGTPVRLPFQVVGEPVDTPADAAPAATPYGDPSRPVADGALNQKPILSRTFVSLATLLVLGVAGLVAYLLLHHTPEDALADRGSPDKPVLVATAAGPDTIALTWKPIDLVESYSLLSVDPPTGNINGQQAVPGSQNAFTVGKLNPATPYCFQLSAVRGGLTGAPSDKVCATTGAAPPSPSPSPSPSPTAATSSAPTSATPTPSVSASPSPSITPGDPATDPIMKQHWILVLDELPGADVTEEMAQQRRDEFRPFVPDVQEVDRSVYPRLLFDPAVSTSPAPTPGATPAPSWLVYLGTFNSPTEATALCASIQTATGTTTCIAAQPDPPQ
ncbi:fibronectin type III domain-containing protein [uncultured Friedmanniella sp.]|uniref:fibronectin type III domain-containing protein n=1 Tax=uncultured Friedmanniella sp. TaxID=335381 RepID=UPI0035CA7ADE